MTTKTPVRVRFAPSPTGYLHVGGARTVLFNWLIARRSGGTFILRIEDTDQTRNVADSVGKILDDLRWLGMTWDEGPEVGGPVGPYLQSERLDTYQPRIDQLLAAGKAYYALESPEDLQRMREAATAKGQVFRYVRPDPLPTIEQGLAARREGRPVVVRFRMPGTDITVHDDILGEVVMAGDQLEDFVIQKADGFPTYHFAVVVDDALMGITHVVRGQEHLMNTPRHVALQQALGVPTPKYAHLPLIFNIDGTKMSKRDKERAIAKGEKPPEIDVHDFRAAGYLPEALLNFLALLGWSAGDDREFFSLAELIERFSIERVGKTNAKFDRAKLASFNTEWSARLGGTAGADAANSPSAVIAANPDRLLAAFRDYLTLSGSTMARFDEGRLRRLLVECAGFRTFADVVAKAGFLTQADDGFAYEPQAVKKVLEKNDGAGYAMLKAVLPRLEGLDDWSGAAIEKLLEAFCAEQNTKLGHVAQPLRVAITGTTVSPSIHASLELLGKAATVGRVKRCLAARTG